jgi:hypothetical protein
VRTPSDQPHQRVRLEDSGQIIELTVDGVKPFCVSKRTLVIAFGGAVKLVDQMLSAALHDPSSKWLKIVRPGSPGVEVLVDRYSAERAYERIRNGELPPLLPSQIKAKFDLAAATKSATKGQSNERKVARKNGDARPPVQKIDH